MHCKGVQSMSGSAQVQDNMIVFSQGLVQTWKACLNAQPPISINGPHLLAWQ